MGDVVSAHLDESRRDMITAKASDVMREFRDVYNQQFPVSLFNYVRFDIEGGTGKQSQLLHRKDPLEGRNIFSGNLFQYLEENRKWRNRFVNVSNNYDLNLYESRTAHERGLHPKVRVGCAGYRALDSMDHYLDLVHQSLPDVKAKAGSHPFIKCATPFPLILWHPYARHHYFCVMTEKEQKKWLAVLQDCVRHANNGLPEVCSVKTSAFTDSVRLYRQNKGHYGTWDMMCGEPPQILANLVMETLHPQLRDVIGRRLKGKLQQRQRHWMMISDAVYRQVCSQTKDQYEALQQNCETQRASLDSRLRTDMDQIITSKEHVCTKIRGLVLPKAEELVRTDVKPYLVSILEALMEPTSQGFSELRDVFSRELVDLSKNCINQGDKDKLAHQMERVSMLAFHPVKMQSCYEKMEDLNLEGLQDRFYWTSPSVFISRAQILMRQLADDAVYTFEQLLSQSLEAQGEEEEEDEDEVKAIQRCQDRVLKKYDYDSSTVRKKFFREALLQIIIPFMLQELTPPCSPELPGFKELIFEDFSQFLVVENLFEEVVLQSVSKDIMMAVRDAAVQRKHNLYRDSMVLTNSDPNLHLLEEAPPVDWAAKFGVEGSPDEVGGGEMTASGKRRKQVVSMIQLDGVPLPYESCMEVPGVELIPEEEQQEGEECKSPDSVNQIRDLLNPVMEVVLPEKDQEAEEEEEGVAPASGTLTMEDGVQEEVTHLSTVVSTTALRDRASAAAMLQQLVNRKSTLEKELQDQEVIRNEEDAIRDAIQEIELAVQDNDLDCEKDPHGDTSCDDSGFKSASKGTNGADDAIQRTDDAIQRTDDAIQRTGDAFQRTGDAFQRTDDAIQRPGDAIQRTDDAIQRTDDAIQRTDDAIQRTDDAIQRTDDAIQRPGDAIQRTDDAIQRTDDAIQRTDDAIQRTGDAIQRTGDAIQPADVTSLV